MEFVEESCGLATLRLARDVAIAIPEECFLMMKIRWGSVSPPIPNRFIFGQVNVSQFLEMRLHIPIVT